MAPDLLIWLLGKPESTDGRVLSWPFSLTAEIAGNHFLTGRFFRGEVVEDDAVLEISPRASVPVRARPLEDGRVRCLHSCAELKYKDGVTPVSFRNAATKALGDS